MALNWHWDEKCGEITLLQQFAGEEATEYTINLYQGNAYLIMIHEFSDEGGTERYELFSFFNDKQHMKNCLGLNPKGGFTSNCFKNDCQRITRLRLNKAKHRHANDIVAAFATAFDDITIEVYSAIEEVAS